MLNFNLYAYVILTYGAVFVSKISLHYIGFCRKVSHACIQHLFKRNVLIENIFIIQNLRENIFDEHFFHTKKIINKNSNNWGSYENELLCNMFVSALHMICLFVLLFSSFLSLPCALVHVLCYCVVLCSVLITSSSHWT